MKLKLNPVNSFNVTNENGSELGIFTLVSHWEGFAKLRDEWGRVVIVQLEDGGDSMADAFLQMFGPTTAPGARTVTAVKMSPGLVFVSNGNLRSAHG